jgi:hypothetical protein
LKPVWWLGGLGLVATSLLGPLARAQGTDEFGAYGGAEQRGWSGSPQNMAFELRFGPYRPRVDSEFGDGATPYANAFGDSTRYMLGFEFDYQALRVPHLGTLGPGVGWGYTSSTAQALIEATRTPSGQDTSLSIMPVYLAGVLRVDVVAQETPVPFAFYAKAGFEYALWWVTSGSQLARAEGAVGSGASYGYRVALGAMLLLDAFDRASATDMDNSVGINSSYVFFEYFRSDLSGLGSGRMQVGTSSWVTGLAFEF